jgi:sterol desaturase/sphingolipid hydroxylase (fatty acid hydroxylase superfamily)
VNEFEFGKGKISGVLALVMSLMSLGAVLCFHFPEALTTPHLREVYPIEFLRKLLAFFIFVSLLMGVVSCVLSESKILGLIGVLISLIATFLGGSTVPVPESVEKSNYLGFDWFILDLLIVVLVFVPVEIFFRRRSQFLFRSQWQTDLAHFFVSHLLIQVTTLLILSPALLLGKYLSVPLVQTFVQSFPLIFQFLAIMALADFTQYWVHRSFHKIPSLWKIHAIHHSVQEMDWLAGSRLHLVDIVVTRAITLVPLFLLGFSDSAMKAYLIFVAFWATFIHTNIKFKLWRIRNIIATPIFHHWHHASSKEAIDKNFAVHLPILDILFNSYYLPKDWPQDYGVAGEPVPDGYWKQLIWPFTRKQ